MSGSQSRYPQPAVVGVVFDPTRRSVLLNRTSEGGWALPGSEFEGGSSWINELGRQLRSLGGIEAKSPRLVGLYAAAEGDPPRARATACFLVTEFQGQPSRDCSWFAFDGLPPELDATDRGRIQDALSFSGDVILR